MRSLLAHSSSQSRSTWMAALSLSITTGLSNLVSSGKLMSKPSVTSSRALVKVLDRTSARTDLCSAPELGLRQESCCAVPAGAGDHVWWCVATTAEHAYFALSRVSSLFPCTFLQKLLHLWAASLQCALGLQLSWSLTLVEWVVGTPSLAVSWRQGHLNMRNSWSLLDEKLRLATPTQQQLGHPTLAHRVPRSLQRAHKTRRISKQSPEAAVQIPATVGGSCLLCSGECRDRGVSYLCIWFQCLCI